MIRPEQTDETTATADTAGGTAGLGRRRVLASGAALGAMGAVGLLSACASDDSAGSDAAATTGDSSSATLAATSEIPVGGGKIFSTQKVVVTQPASGDFKAFSASCTHQGCLVTQVADSKITCACHQSIFSARDGSVISGPATTALPAQAITIENDEIKLA